MGKIRLGIIGLGSMGKGHAKTITDKVPEIEITAVADIDLKNLEWASAEIPDAARYEKADDLMDSGLVDAVLIVTPHYDHPSLSTAALERGLNVLVEKPAGVYTKQVRLANETYEKIKEESATKAKSAPVFAIMYNERTNHIYRKMRELVQGGTLGAIRRVNWIVTHWYRPQSYYDSGTWRATWKGEGGGVLLNQCPHNLDLLQWICGMPVMVNAHIHSGKWHDIEVEDDVTAYLEFSNGATGVFVTSTADAPGTNRFEITFDKGKLVAEDGELTLWELECTEQEFSQKNTEMFGSPAVTKAAVETDGENEQHAAVIKAFAGAILRGEPLIGEGTEGINGLMVSNAIHLSGWLGKKVELPIDEDLFYDELKKRY
jgi:predicted dehydrogenase